MQVKMEPNRAVNLTDRWSDRLSRQDINNSPGTLLSAAVNGSTKTQCAVVLMCVDYFTIIT